MLGSENVIATDYLSESVELIERNIKRNDISNRVVSKKLDWNHLDNWPRDRDIILGSEVDGYH